MPIKIQSDTNLRAQLLTLSGLVEYSTDTLIFLSPTVLSSLSFSWIGPTNSKFQERVMYRDAELDEGGYYAYKATIYPVFTAGIRGDVGQAIVSFRSEALFSPIVKVPVNKSLLPEQTELPITQYEEIGTELNTLHEKDAEIEATIDDVITPAIAALEAGKAEAVHEHVEADITDLDKYTQAEVNAKIGEVAEYIEGVIEEQAPIQSTDDLPEGSTNKYANANATNQGNTFNGAEQLVKLAADGKLPALDGSDLTGIIAGLVDSLTSTSTTEGLTANQGRVLKSLIDALSALLLSDETDLDTLQEIVDYIETNRDTLDALGIDGITGLTAALAGKEPADANIVKAPGGVLPALDGSNLTGIAGGGGEYANTLIVAKTGGQYTTIQSAINASASGDLILVYPGTYTEAVTTKTGGMTSIVGVGAMGSVVIQQNTGVCLTIPNTAMSMAFIKNLKIKSTSVGVNASKLVYSSGMMVTYNNVSFDYDINNGNTEAVIDLQAGQSAFMTCRFDYKSIGTNTGDNNMISANNAAAYQILQGFSTVSVADVAANHVHFISDSSSASNVIKDLNIRILAETASYAGHMDFIHSTNTNDIECIGNNIVFYTPSGVAGSYGQAYHLAGTSGGHIHSSGNRITIEGFESNYIGNIASTESLISHFDDIVAEDGILGTGTYAYLNSPFNGSMQMSGDIISKLINITADYDASESWDTIIMNSNATSEITATFNITKMSGLPNGAKRTFTNHSASSNFILDPNTISLSDSTAARAIYPGGYIIIEKIGDEFLITASSNTSLNIDFADVPNKEFHIDFSDESTITVSGDDITEIEDKINSVVGTPSSSGRVDYGNSSQNGLNTGLWNTANSPMSFGDIDLHSNLEGRGMTVITVIKPRYSGDAIISKYADNVANREWRLLTSAAVIYDELDGSGSEATLNFSSNYDEWQILGMTWSPGGKLAVYKNGFLMGTSAYTTDDIASGTANVLIGASDYTGMDYMGEIGEIIVISNTPTEDMRQAMVSRLGAKWGIDVAVFSASDSSPFGRDDETDTIKPLIENDNLDLGAGEIHAGDIYSNEVLLEPNTWRNVVNDLTTGGTSVSLSAEQGKTLKGLVDAINALLTSDESTLDTLQEVVNYIETNRSTLDALGISGITGLQTALDAKVAIVDLTPTNYPAFVGNDGATGATGATGDTGATGATGAAGADGEDGSDANVTKANVEAVLTGAITTHSHAWRGIIDTLVSTSATDSLSANQGRVLKGLIDSLTSLVASDETDLDTLQEIVDYIETNRSTLDALGISGITGLQAALDGKVDDSQVLTDVPAGAVFSDTIYTLTKAAIEALLTGELTSHSHASDNTDIQLTDEEVQDIIGAMLNITAAQTGISITYNDTTGKLDIDLSHTHTVTKADVGLGDVDNTADTAKNVNKSEKRNYVTTCPTAINSEGIRTYVGSTDCATKYSGWEYLITE